MPSITRLGGPGCTEELKARTDRCPAPTEAASAVTHNTHPRLGATAALAVTVAAAASAATASATPRIFSTAIGVAVAMAVAAASASASVAWSAAVA
jgi:hypothetical protein